LLTNRTLLLQVPLLRAEPQSVQAAVLERLRKQIINKGEYVYMEGTYATSMSFLTRGVVNLYQGTEKIIALGDGSFVGAIDCLFSSVRLLTVQAVTDIEIYIMERKDINYVIGEHLTFGARLRRKCLQRLERFGMKLKRNLVEPQFLRQMQEMGIGVLAGMNDAEVESALQPLKAISQGDFTGSRRRAAAQAQASHGLKTYRIVGGSIIQGSMGENEDGATSRFGEGGMSTGTRTGMEGGGGGVHEGTGGSHGSGEHVPTTYAAVDGGSNA